MPCARHRAKYERHVGELSELPTVTPTLRCYLALILRDAVFPSYGWGSLEDTRQPQHGLETRRFFRLEASVMTYLRHSSENVNTFTVVFLGKPGSKQRSGAPNSKGRDGETPMNSEHSPYEQQLLNGTQRSPGWGMGFFKTINTQKLSVSAQRKVLLSMNRHGMKREGGQSAGQMIKKWPCSRPLTSWKDKHNHDAMEKVGICHFSQKLY